MKKIFTCLSVFILISTIPGAFASDIEMSTAIRYNGFNGHNDGSASQMVMPVRFQWGQGNLDLAVTTAYVATEYDPQGGNKYSLEGFIDTQASIGYQIADRLPFDILLGLDVNLPTGMSDLSAKDTILTKHSDHLTVSTFGEGWNFTPTLVLVKDWRHFSIGAGVGYAFRGEYDFNKTIQDYNPGDRLTVSAEINYDIGQNLLGKAFITHSTYGKDQVDGDDYFRESDFNLVGASMQYLQNNWDASASLQLITRGKAEINDGSGNIASESKKSITDEYLIDLMYRYTIDTTTLNTSLQYKFSDENDYQKTANAYTDKKSKTSLNFGISKPLTETLSGNINVAGFYMEEGKAPGFPSDENRTYIGGSISVGVSARF